MATQTIGIIMNGATGRICSTQHLANALAPIRAEGGLPAGNDRIVPRLMLAGRNAEKLAALAKSYDAEWTTDLDTALGDPAFSVFFEAAATHQREASLKRAIEAGKNVYSEKPVALSVERGLALAKAADAKGLKHGAVEDKLYLPGLQKLSKLAASDFFGRVVGFRIDFGWWVFDGTEVPCQRPSWNYKKKEGGGLILDMYPHWRYVIENMLGPMRRVITTMSTATPVRVDEGGARYDVDVEDNASTLIELESGATGVILSSWATRVRRDDLLTVQIDGTKGSAIAGLHRCWTSTNAQTPRTAHFNIVTDMNIDYRANWQEVAAEGPYKNPYRVGWENFLPHVATGAPMRATLAAGVRDVQFAEACYQSMKDGRWIGLSTAGQQEFGHGRACPDRDVGRERSMLQKTALVTGTSTGLGLAIAIGLAQAGYDLALTDLDVAMLRDTLKQPDIAKRKTVAISLDLRSQGSIKAAFEEAWTDLGPIDLLVNNAGRALLRPVVDVSEADWDDVIDTNLKGAFFLSQLFGRACIAADRPGAIVSMASTHGMTGIAGRSVYGISKAGLIQMTRMLAIEWADKNIRINAVAPTTVMTESRQQMLADPVARETALARIPSGRFATAEEIAAAVVYLASDGAASVTGHTLPVDGGLTAI